MTHGSHVGLSGAINRPLSRTDIRRLATLYARRELTTEQTKDFERRFQTDIEFRRAAAVKLLGSEPSPSDELAFAAAHPHLAQFDLRRRRWRESPYRHLFAGFDVGTMRMAGEPDPAPDANELQARHESIRDERRYWASGRSYQFTYDELHGNDETFSTVRSAILDGVDDYFIGCLRHTERFCFEQWYIRSRDFRKYVIPYLATAERRVSNPEYDPGMHTGDPRCDGRYAAGVRQFKYELSTPKQLAGAEQLAARMFARLGLPAVDMRTGELLPDKLELRLVAA